MSFDTNSRMSILIEMSIALLTALCVNPECYFIQLSQYLRTCLLLCSKSWPHSRISTTGTTQTRQKGSSSECCVFERVQVGGSEWGGRFGIVPSHSHYMRPSTIVSDRYYQLIFAIFTFIGIGRFCFKSIIGSKYRFMKIGIGVSGHRLRLMKMYLYRRKSILVDP